MDKEDEILYREERVINCMARRNKTIKVELGSEELDMGTKVIENSVRKSLVVN